MRFQRLILAAPIIVVLCSSLPSFAEQKQHKNTDQALARAQALLKQVATQKAQVEADLAKLQADLAIKTKQNEQQINKLKTDLKDKQDTLQEAQSSLVESTRNNASLGSDLNKTRNRLQQTEDKLREVIQKYKETAHDLLQTRDEKATLETRLAEQTRQTGDSESKNLKLYEANVELLKKLQDKGPVDALLQREPFTGIKQVQIENILEEYSYKLDQLKIDQPPKPAPP